MDNMKTSCVLFVMVRENENLVYGLQVCCSCGYKAKELIDGAKMSDLVKASWHVTQVKKP